MMKSLYCCSSPLNVLVLVSLAFAIGCDAPAPISEQRTTAPPQITPTPPAPRPDLSPAVARATEALVAAAATAREEARDASVPPWKPRKILMIGDSMVWFLGEAIAPKLEAEGHEFMHLHKASDSLRAWRYQSSGRLKKALRRYDPDVVIIVMGTNDYWYPRIERLLPTVRDTISAVGDRPCYWVGPPMWRPDTGVIDMLARHSSPCRFFDSKPLTIERKRDGIHPTDAGAATWATALHAWLRRNPPGRIHVMR